MTGWVRELDRILRGQATQLRAIEGGKIDLNAGRLMAILILLGALYGFCMGWFALLNRPEGAEWRQLAASMFKVPLLFFLTLAVTFPSLYVFNALMGSRLRFRAMAHLLLAAMAVILAVLASFGPIVAFFSVTTTSHPFMLLLNVAAFAVAGVIGMTFLLRTLHRLSVVIYGDAIRAWEEAEAREEEGAAGAAGAEENAGAGEAAEARGEREAEVFEDEGALDPLEGVVQRAHVKTVFRMWVVMFALVGAQMSWVLRPFVGTPGVEFAWFRARESNFFEAVWQSLQRLLGG